MSTVSGAQQWRPSLSYDRVAKTGRVCYSRGAAARATLEFVRKVARAACSRKIPGGRWGSADQQMSELNGPMFDGFTPIAERNG